MRRLGFVLVAIFIVGCGSSPTKTKGRIGRTFGVLETVAPENLGTHILSEASEGYVYCLDGGIIDIGHMRVTTDLTIAISNQIYENVKKGNDEFLLEIRHGTACRVKLGNRESWQMTEREVASIVGARVIHIYSVFHEMKSWINHGMMFPSAFAAEDGYSDLLGVVIGWTAFQRNETSPQQITLLINEKLEELKRVSHKETVSYIRKSKPLMNKGRWPLPTRIKRDFDIWDVEVSPCLAQNPRGLWAPSLGPLKNFVKITIEASGETSKALRLIGERNTVELEPLIHFPLIIEKIKWESETKYKNSVL